MNTKADGWQSDRDEAWLAQVQEPILDPDLPIVDPHHHLFTWPVHYLLPELLKDLKSGHNIRATVHIDAHSHYRTAGPEHLKPVGETEFLAKVAREADQRTPGVSVCAGIVGAVDIMRGAAVGEVLDAHIAAADGRFRGIRLHPFWRFERDGRIYLDPDWQEIVEHPAFLGGVAEVRKRGLAIDLVAFNPCLLQVARLARRAPATIFVVNHFGAPTDIEPAPTDELMAAWRAGIDALAACPNVRLKLGGLCSGFISKSLPGFKAFHNRQSPLTSPELAEQYRPLVDYCIDRLGPQRCMFESNFPMDRRFVSYAVLWNTFKLLAQPYSPDERHALFSATATAAYKLNIAGR